MNDEKENMTAEGRVDEIVNIVKKASDKASLMCFAVKFVIVAGVYIALKHFVDLAAAELWMLISLAFSIYSNECTLGALTTAQVMTDFLEKGNEEHEKALEDSESKT